MLSQVFFVDERFSDEELPKDSSSSARVSTSLGTKGSFPLSQVFSCASRPLSHASFPGSRFFQFGLAASHSCHVCAQPNLVTLSSVLLVSLAFSPCPNANGGIGLLATGSSECSSLKPSSCSL